MIITSGLKLLNVANKMTARCLAIFAAISALLQPLRFVNAANPLPDADSIDDIDATAAEQEAIKLGFSWPMMDLTSLRTNNFLSAIDEHDLSVVVFYTNQAPIWPLARTILKTVHSILPYCTVYAFLSRYSALFKINVVFVIDCLG